MRSTQIAARLLVTIALLSAVPATMRLPAPVLAQSPARDSRKTQALQLSKRGQQLLDISRFSEALTVYQYALRLYQQIGDRAGEVTTLNSIGWSYSNLGQHPRALESYQQALKIAQAVGDRVGEGYALNGIGSAYDSLGQYAKALESYQQALKIFQAIGDHTKQGDTINGIGVVYLNLGQYLKAFDYYQQGLKIAVSQSAGNRTREVDMLNGIATVYYMLGQTSSSLDYHHQALKISQAVGYRTGESRALMRIGAIYSILRQAPKGLDSFQQALKIFRAVGDRAGESQALSIIGAMNYELLGQTPEALNYLQQALKISQAIENRPEEGKILGLIGHVLVRSGQFNAAEQSLSQAISIYEQLRPGLRDGDKISFSDARRHPYKSLQKALVAQNKTASALEVSERGRTRAFVELLATRLAGNSTHSQALQRLSQPISLAQIQQVAQQQNATLVEYSVVEKDLYIWLIRPTGQIEFRKTPYRFTQAQLQELVSVTRGDLRRGADRSGNSPAVSQSTNARLNQFGAYPLRQLHQLLIEPIADLLPKNPSDRVVFIPQNELLLVPFSALIDARGNYLIEQHTLVTAPSIQVLSLTEQNQQRLNNRDRTALVVGNPTIPKLSSGVLAPLPAAEQEARTVAQLLNTKAMIGDTANKATVISQMPQARFIHLATHALLTANNDDAPGAIVLAPDRPNQVNDGLLTPAEILQMKLKAEMVVLSACDTAKGDVTSDGIVGLSRSLIAAGVPSVVVSLWNVNDESTAFLMSEFYRNLQQGRSDPHRDRAVALRQAMLTTMKRPEFASPYDWAAFTLIGEAQ